jgi:N utilization substance protein A
MRGEKIDIVPFSEDLPDFVAKALSPAKVTQVILSEDGTQADVIVPDHQLSLAIGREGQNARLSARLTGVRVDIRSETQLAEGVPAGGEEEDVDYADGQWVANKETGEMEWHAADGSVISESAWQAQQAAAAAAEQAAEQKAASEEAAAERAASEEAAAEEAASEEAASEEAPAEEAASEEAASEEAEGEEAEGEETPAEEAPAEEAASEEAPSPDEPADADEAAPAEEDPVD